MKQSKLIQERSRRVAVLLRELGYEIHDGEVAPDSYSGSITASDGFQLGMFVDADSKFLELVFTFTFSASMADFVRERMDEIIHTLYEYGCYFTMHVDTNDIVFSIFSKIYFAGLNYFSLKETIKDLREAIDAHQEIFELPIENEKESDRGD